MCTVQRRQHAVRADLGQQAPHRQVSPCARQVSPRRGRGQLPDVQSPARAPVGRDAWAMARPRNTAPRRRQ
eukprot:8708316-Alexandrium_andersonii.AAC.1